MDWVKDFEKRFENDEILPVLKQDKFHGNVTLNFSDGAVINCKINMNIIPTPKQGG